MKSLFIALWITAATTVGANAFGQQPSDPPPEAPPYDAPPIYAPIPLPVTPPEPSNPKPPSPPLGPRHVSLKKSLATRLEWRWPKFGLPELGLSIGQAALAIGSVFIPEQRNWTATNDFDESARSALRLKVEQERLTARDASDVGVVLLLNQQLIDTLFITWWLHDKGSTAFQMALVDLQTVSFASGVNGVITGLVGRQRPYPRVDCKEGGIRSETSDCLGPDRYQSFYSGHTTLAFTLASLTCVHHINLPLYGGGAVEAIPCAMAMATASGVGLLRLAGDQHYLSDVLTGAAFGTAVGFAIPYLFYYAHSKENPNATLKAMGFESFSIGPSAGGAQMGGLF